VVPPHTPPVARSSHRRRRVAIVVSRFHENITSKLLDGARDALRRAGIADGDVNVVHVPGAFELPVAAEAAAVSERFDMIVALGCVIRGETPHFDFIASEAASGLQLAARHDEALEHYRRALEINKALSDRWGTARTLTRLGRTSASTGDSDTARWFFRQALSLLDVLADPRAAEVRAHLKQARTPVR